MRACLYLTVFGLVAPAAIADVDGELGNLELRCEWQHFADQAREGVTWAIPESWGDCSLVVHGETGSTFKLFEIPATT